MNDKETARNIIDSYRKRQKWSQIGPLVFFAVVVVVVLGVVLLVNTLTGRGGPSLPLPATDTPTPTETLAPTETVTQTLPPLEPQSPLVTEQLGADESPEDPQNTVYVVKEGDTLASISQQLAVSLPVLMALNPNIDPDLIVVGQEIVVPAQGSTGASATSLPEGFQGMIDYRVVAGDTLFDIATRHGSTVAAIVQENGLENANDIMVGDLLKIPVNVSPGDSTAPAPPGEATATETPAATP